MKHIENIEKWGEWGWRAICLALLVANLWLKGNFVGLEKYEKDKKETDTAVANISQILTTMQERDKVNDRQDARLQDHEDRLRSIERVKVTSTRRLASPKNPEDN